MKGISFTLLLALPVSFITYISYNWIYADHIEIIEMEPRVSDVIIVLGGGYMTRAQHGSELYHMKYAPKVLLVGGGDTGLNEAILEQRNVPDSDIVIESHSRNTYENALFAKSYLNDMNVKKAILVTSKYHSKRALKTFEHLIPEVQFLSVPAPKEVVGAADVLRECRYEFFKSWFYLFGYGIVI